MGLLTHGYDVHLHFGSYGTRTIMMTLPNGLPGDESAWSPFLNWNPNKTGGGILALQPCFEPGYLHDVWEFDEYLEALVSVRNEIINGDLRSLFVFALCGAEDSYECYFSDGMPPVPAGIGEVSQACYTLLGFYGIGPHMLQVLSETVGPAPSQPNQIDFITPWVNEKSEIEVRKLLCELLGENTSQCKAEALAAARSELEVPSWPVTPCPYSWEELIERTNKLISEENARIRAKEEAAAKRKARKQEKKRQKRMQEMAENPEQWLAQTDALVQERGTENYHKATEILIELQQAIGGDAGKQVVYKHAAHLTKTHPTLHKFKSILRKRGLLS